MAYFMKSLILSAVRNRGIVNRINTLSTLPSDYLNYNNVSAESPRLPNLSLVTKEHDVLMENIRMCEDKDEIFKVVKVHSEVMNEKHVVESLKSLFELYKNNTNMPVESVSMHPSFDRLCASVKKTSRTMDLYEIMDCIKVLSYFGVKGRSTVFQYLLQLIRQNINHLSLNQIMFLDFILRKIDDTHLGDSLKLALPLAFQLQIGLQMDHENVAQVVELLKYAAKNNIPEKYMNNIVTSLILHLQDVDFKLAKSVFYSLSEMDVPWDSVHPNYKKLLGYSLNKIGQNIDNFSYAEVIRTLNFIRDSMHKGNFFYNSNFMTSCSQYAINHKLDFHKSLQISNVLNKMYHVHFELCDYIVEMIQKDNALLSKANTFSIISFTNTLSNSNYKPKGWDSVKHLILKNPLIHSTKIEIPWIRLILDLEILDVHSDELFEKIFDETFLTNYLSRKINFVDYLQLLTLTSLVQICYPSYSGSLPPPGVLRKATEYTVSKNVDPAVRTALELSLGGPQYVATSVLMPNMMFADFVVHYKDGKYPMAFSNKNGNGANEYAKFNIDNNENTVCILCFNASCYSANNHRLRGMFNLFVELLERLNFKVVPLSIDKWKSMPSVERIPYLMREINSTIELDAIEGTPT